jgi:hypothetical protein
VACIPHVGNDRYVSPTLAEIAPSDEHWEGMPKLITYTHRMMASLDSAELMPDADEETMNQQFQHRRWYTPLPSLHASPTLNTVQR